MVTLSCVEVGTSLKATEKGRRTSLKMDRATLLSSAFFCWYKKFWLQLSVEIEGLGNGTGAMHSPVGTTADLSALQLISGA